MTIGLAAGLHAATASVKELERIPAGILAVAASAEGPSHVLVAEKASQLLHVYGFERGVARLRRVYPCTTGRVRGDKAREGDLKTPEGVYWFTRRIPGTELPPLYGAGALVMDYPNPFDLLEGKTGSGIWLHGVESDERAGIANDTRGCVAVRNDHFAEIRRLVEIDETPILVVERMDMASPADLAVEARAVASMVERWRHAWEGKDLETYLTFYDDRFRSGGGGLDTWMRAKREVARREGGRRIATGDMTILREKQRYWIRFRQEYASDQLQDAGEKTLLVRRADDEWRIIGESWREIEEPFRLIEPVRVAVREPDAMIASLESLPADRTMSGEESRTARDDPKAPGQVKPARLGEPVGALPVPADAAPPVLSGSESTGNSLAKGPEPPASVAAEPGAPALPSAEAGVEARAVELVIAPARQPDPRAPPEPAPPLIAPAVPPVESPLPPPAAPMHVGVAGPRMPPTPRTLETAVGLLPARVSKGPFHLGQPSVRPQEGSLVVFTQLLSATPSTTRTITLVVSVTTSAEPGREVSRERFTVRQGRDVTVTVDASALPSTVTILTLDEAGRVVLDQDMRVDPP